MEFDNLNEYYYNNIDIIETNNTNPNINNSIKLFVCDECGASYKYYSGLYSHKRHHDPNYIKKYSCSLCDYSHDNIYHLYSHKNTHKDDNESKFEIITNERTLYRQPSKYRKLYSTEEKNFSCPTCDKKYNSRQSIQVHMKTHDKDRIFKFSCTECDFKCDHKAQFKRHINSHD
jgi:hypothetical protein